MTHWSNLEKYYADLHAREEAVQAALFKDADAKGRLIRAHSLYNDFATIVAEFSGHFEKRGFEQAKLELQRGLYCLTTGDYRTAFFALRLALELSLSSLAYSTDLILLKRWLNGEGDTNWAGLLDAETGVFSHTYVKTLFRPGWDFAADHRELARKVYRELSEYVHGAVPTHDALDEMMTFQPLVDNAWHDKYYTVFLIISYVAFVRYATDATPDARNKVEDIYMREFGHLAPIRDYFSS